MFYLLYLTKRGKEKHFFVIFSLRVFSETYHPTPWLTAEVRFHHLGSTLQKAWALSYVCINELCWDEQLDNGGMQSKHARWMQLMFHLIAAGVGLKSCIFLLFLKKISNEVDLGFLFAVLLLSPVISNLTCTYVILGVYQTWNSTNRALRFFLFPKETTVCAELQSLVTVLVLECVFSAQSQFRILEQFLLTWTTPLCYR